ncbi:MAG: dockerin type I domain-containing protein [Planctomycetota bacterium]
MAMGARVGAMVFCLGVWCVLGLLPAPLEAALVADPIAVDFGGVAIAKSADADTGGIRCFVEVAIRIENPSAAPVEIASVTVVESADVPNPSFELKRHDCGSLPPGGACTALVRYAPRARGGHSASLEVRASDGTELVVPLWGDAVEVAWEGSELEVPALAFPAAPPGSQRSRILGIANDTAGDVLANAALEGSEAFSAELPPPMGILPPGGEVSAAVTCTYAAPPGVRQAVLIWNVPPPMLPVVRALRIPLSAEVVTCLETSRTSSVPREQAEAFGKRQSPPPFALVPRPDGGSVALSRRLLVPLPSRQGSALGICGVRFAPGDPAPRFGEWATLPEVGDEVVIAFAPVFTARPQEVGEANAPLSRRLKARALSLSRKRAVLWGPDPVTGMITDIDIYDCHSHFLGPLARSALSQSRAYAVARGEGGIYIAALSAKREKGGQILATPELEGTAGWLPNYGPREAASVRAFAPVAVREANGTWREKFVAVARYADADTGGDEQVLLLLLRPEGDVRNFNFKVEIEGVTQLPPGSGIVTLAARRKKAASCEDRRPEIYALLGSREGRISAYGCLREGERAWSWRRKRDLVLLGGETLPLEEVSFNMFFRGEEAYSVASCEEVTNRRAFDHIGNFCAVSGRKIFFFEGTGAGYELVARKRMAEAEWISVARPMSLRPGEKPALYVLEKRKAGGVVLSALDLCVRELRGTSHNTGKPVLLSGDCTFLARAAAGEPGARITLEAYAFDPDGSALTYSWTAPGIEFDDPTSPKPSAFFPVGETDVYLVVRDGPALSAETRESDPRLVRVVVVSEPVLASCGDANGDGSLDISDAVWTLTYLFAGGAPPASMQAADTNGDGKLDISDPIYLLGYLFLGGPPPVCPVVG